MGKPIALQAAFPRLFARCTTDGPDDLVEELKAAGMLAAAWQVEAMQEELDRARADFEELDLNVPSDCRTTEDLEKRDEEIKEDAAAQARADTKAEFERHVSALEDLLDRGGHLKRADVEEIAQALREILG
jgi:hypothetical protein